MRHYPFPKNNFNYFYECQVFFDIRRVLLVARKEVPTVREKLTTYERHESIKLYLFRERETTTMRLAFMFNVSRQTIMNDIVFLSRRLPITTKVGGGGGIFLDVKFEMPKDYLSNEEEKLLIALSEIVTGKDKQMIMNIINKFSVKSGKWISQNNDV